MNNIPGSTSSSNPASHRQWTTPVYEYLDRYHTAAEFDQLLDLIRYFATLVPLDEGLLMSCDRLIDVVAVTLCPQGRAFLSRHASHNDNSISFRGASILLPGGANVDSVEKQIVAPLLSAIHWKRGAIRRRPAGPDFQQSASKVDSMSELRRFQLPFVLNSETTKLVHERWLLVPLRNDNSLVGKFVAVAAALQNLMSLVTHTHCICETQPKADQYNTVDDDDDDDSDDDDSGPNSFDSPRQRKRRKKRMYAAKQTSGAKSQPPVLHKKDRCQPLRRGSGSDERDDNCPQAVGVSSTVISKSLLNAINATHSSPDCRAIPDPRQLFESRLNNRKQGVHQETQTENPDNASSNFDANGSLLHGYQRQRSSSDEEDIDEEDTWTYPDDTQSCPDGPASPGRLFWKTYFQQSALTRTRQWRRFRNNYSLYYHRLYRKQKKLNDSHSHRSRVRQVSSTTGASNDSHCSDGKNNRPLQADVQSPQLSPEIPTPTATSTPQTAATPPMRMTTPPLTRTPSLPTGYADLLNVATGVTSRETHAVELTKNAQAQQDLHLQQDQQESTRIQVQLMFLLWNSTVIDIIDQIRSNNIEQYNECRAYSKSLDTTLQEVLTFPEAVGHVFTMLHTFFRASSVGTLGELLWLLDRLKEIATRLWVFHERDNMARQCAADSFRLTIGQHESQNRQQRELLDNFEIKLGKVEEDRDAVTQRLKQHLSEAKTITEKEQDDRERMQKGFKRQLSDIKAKHGTLESELYELKAQLLQARGAAEHYKQQLDINAETQRVTSTTTTTTLQAQIAQLQALYENNASSLAEQYNSNIKKATGELRELRQRLDILLEDNATLKAENATNELRWSELRRQLDERNINNETRLTAAVTSLETQLRKVESESTRRAEDDRSTIQLLEERVESQLKTTVELNSKLIDAHNAAVKQWDLSQKATVVEDIDSIGGIHNADTFDSPDSIERGQKRVRLEVGSGGSDDGNLDNTKHSGAQETTQDSSDTQVPTADNVRGQDEKQSVADTNVLQGPQQQQQPDKGEKPKTLGGNRPLYKSIFKAIPQRASGPRKVARIVPFPQPIQRQITRRRATQRALLEAASDLRAPVGRQSVASKQLRQRVRQVTASNANTFSDTTRSGRDRDSNIDTGAKPKKNSAESGYVVPETYHKEGVGDEVNGDKTASFSASASKMTVDAMENDGDSDSLYDKCGLIQESHLIDASDSLYDRPHSRSATEQLTGASFVADINAKSYERHETHHVSDDFGDAMANIDVDGEEQPGFL